MCPSCNRNRPKQDPPSKTGAAPAGPTTSQTRPLTLVLKEGADFISTDGDFSLRYFLKSHKHGMDGMSRGDYRLDVKKGNRPCGALDFDVTDTDPGDWFIEQPLCDRLFTIQWQDRSTELRVGILPLPPGPPLGEEEMRGLAAAQMAKRGLTRDEVATSSMRRGTFIMRGAIGGESQVLILGAYSRSLRWGRVSAEGAVVFTESPPGK